MSKKYKSGDYLRLSKEDAKNLKSDESISIESQRMIIESFCKFQNIELVEEYVDDGFSGSNFDRPAFKRMIEDIESGKINCVITKDFSRLGRELYQTGTYIEDYFKDKGVRYIAINDGYDSLNDNDNMISMKLAFNDYYLRDISKKVKSALKAKKINGDYIGSIPKYGFLKDPNNHNHLIIDPIASLVVKRIFKMALEGYSCYSIANILTEEKIPIPIVYKKEPRGAAVKENDGYGIWRHQTIRDILTSEMYIGNMVQNMFEKTRYNSKKIHSNSPEDYIIVEDMHEPIIDKNTFNEVQDILRTNAKVKYNRKNKDKYLFSGLLICKECGHKLTILEKKNKGNNSHYTQCSQYTKKGRYGVCNIHRINYNLLEEDLINIITNVASEFLKEYDAKSLTEEANLILQEEITSIQTSIDLLNREISKYDTAIEQLYMDKVENKIPENIFDNLLKKYDNELKNATNKKIQLEDDKNTMLEKVEKLDYDSCARCLKKFLTFKHPSRNIILELVNRVEIDNDKNVKLFFNFNEISSFVR